MGNVLFQAMTKSEENITRKSINALPSPQQMQALPSTSPLQACALPPIPNQNISMPETKKRKISEEEQENYGNNALIPYEPNFDEDPVSDIDLLLALCEVENKEHTPIVPTTNAITQRIMNNLPKSMFSNCSNVPIGTINFNINK